MKIISNRYEFVYLFDVVNGNPNGDPDAGNLPRLDPETNQGLVTDVCIKRKIRNYVNLSEKKGCDIFLQEKRPLNPLIAEACKESGQKAHKKSSGGWDTNKAKKRSQKDIATLQEWLCKKYYDIRTFGAVMSTGPNAGQIRGPVQLAFAESVDPIIPLEVAITRVADVDKEEGEMGRKHIVPYGLYRMHGFISAKLAERTGFSEDDLQLFWEALTNMFEHDRSAARGEMSARKLIVFKHDSPMGNAPAHTLFDLIAVEHARSDEGESARKFSDYRITFDSKNAPSGVSVDEKF